MREKMTKAERDEIRWLRKVAKIVGKMVEKFDYAAVEKHAREWPGTMGPDLRTSAARTRDLMTALHMADIAGRAALQKDTTHG